MSNDHLSPTRRALAMAALILAGETVFIPAFHPGRFFKSSLMASLGINELQLGEAQAWYGVFAMACYLLGGPIADRFAPRTLLSMSLVASGLGSLYMATLPSLLGLKVLFGFWGAATILAFWAPLIRATREWGGQATQGRAFGILDAGRGLVAAVMAQVAAFAVAGQLSAGAETEASAVRWITASYGVASFIVAAFVFVCVPKTKVKAEGSGGAARHVFDAIKRPAIWLQAVVVICAYCAYKTVDFYGLYSEDAFGLSKEQSAHLVVWLSYLRVGAAIAAGVVADRWLGTSRTVAAGFLALATGYTTLLWVPPSEGFFGLAVASMAISAAACFALRGVYFALLEESNVPPTLTGTAVGVVSFIGFTPEVFMPWLSGYFVASARERGEVLVGYHQLWLFLAIAAGVGFVAALLLRRRGNSDLSSDA